MARWTRRETLLALSLYFETPFGKQHKTHPPIVELALQLGRTPSSIGMKLCNFTSLDPVELERGIKGLSGASKLDREIWNEFHENQSKVVVEIEQLLEESSHFANLNSSGEDQALEPFNSDVDDEVMAVGRVETEVVNSIKQRRHQNFFRRIVLRSHNNRCCVTSNPIPDLLRASHIVPWSKSVDERLNPRNGLCLAATFDAAFDRGLIGFDETFRLLINPQVKKYLPDERVQTEFISREGNAMILPEKNLPDAELLRWHRKNVFDARA